MKLPLHTRLAIRAIDTATLVLTATNRYILRRRARKRLREKQRQSLGVWGERWEVATVHCWNILRWEGEIPDKEVLAKKMRRFDKNHNKLLTLIDRRIAETKVNLG